LVEPERMQGGPLSRPVGILEAPEDSVGAAPQGVKGLRLRTKSAGVHSTTEINAADKDKALRR
jgi:hypothetical protein